MINTENITEINSESIKETPFSITLFLNAILRFIFRNLVVFVAIAFVFSIPFWLPGMVIKRAVTEPVPIASQETIAITQKKLSKEIEKLDKKIQSKTPRTYYLVINSASNEFSLYNGTKLIKRDKCSTGSYVLLKNDAQQQWMFKTPKGEFRIQGKTTSPVWRKPDWAFVEEGLPVPPENHYSRWESGVLGDYALSLGKGYLIHGTLYQRFLGLPVTHGCIRLNDASLELVYNALQISSKVYIY